MAQGWLEIKRVTNTEFHIYLHDKNNDDEKLVIAFIVYNWMDRVWYFRSFYDLNDSVLEFITDHLKQISKYTVPVIFKHD